MTDTLSSRDIGAPQGRGRRGRLDRRCKRDRAASRRVAGTLSRRDAVDAEARERRGGVLDRSRLRRDADGDRAARRQYGARRRADSQCDWRSNPAVAVAPQSRARGRCACQHDDRRGGCHTGERAGAKPTRMTACSRSVWPPKGRRRSAAWSRRMPAARAFLPTAICANWCSVLRPCLPSGEIWSGLGGLRKDNTGYDLKQLFIGAEGTLGVVTAATLKLFPKPAAIETAIAAVVDVQSAVALLNFALARGAITAFELMPRIGVEFVLRHVAGHARSAGTRLSVVRADRCLVARGCANGRGADPAGGRREFRSDRRRRRGAIARSARKRSGNCATVFRKRRSPKAAASSTTSRCRSHRSRASSRRHRAP